MAGDNFRVDDEGVPGWVEGLEFEDMSRRTNVSSPFKAYVRHWT